MISIVKRLDKLSVFIRWRAFLFLTVLGFFGFIFFLFAVDSYLKDYVEKVGTIINGGHPVNIGSLQSSILRSKLEIKGLEIAHHIHPMKNLAEIDKLHLKFRVGPLFRKKVIIDELTVEGIHYKTDRRTSGGIVLNQQAGSIGPGLIDRVAAGVYSELRDELESNPLRNLRYVKNGIDISTELNKVRSELVTPRKLFELRELLSKLTKHWEQYVWDLPKPSYFTEVGSFLAQVKRQPSMTTELIERADSHRKTLHSEITKVQTSLENLSQEADSFYQAVHRVQDELDRDVDRLKVKLRLPRLDRDDLSSSLFGPKLLNYLERMTYWVDLARRRMPKGSQEGKLKILAQERSSGTSFHFGKIATYPAFLLFKGSVNSQLSEDRSQGKVKGIVTGLTTDPPIYGKPTEFSIEADFPTSHIEGVQAAVTIDHTGDKEGEKIHFSISSFPLEGWNLNDTADLKLELERAIASLSVDLTFDEKVLHGDIHLSAHNIDYSVNCHNKQIEDTLKSILTTQDSLALKATIEGPLDEMKLSASSTFGQVLSSGLRKEFTHQLAAVTDNLRSSLLDLFDPQKRELLARFKELLSKVTGQLQTAHKNLEDLQTNTSKVIARLGSANPADNRAADRGVPRSRRPADSQNF
ncbi:MAG: TIGR03545 family protein [Deltaproteobacteria bacterium]|nr:TIGR03545 family protein [Deltaproteobacteria bacterium]